MTVKELKKELEKYPDSMEVFLGQRITDFDNGLLESVTSKSIQFSEEPGGEVLCEDECVILSEQ